MTSEESEHNDSSSDSSRELKKKRKHKHKEKKHKKKKTKHSSDLERKKRKKKKSKSSKEKKVIKKKNAIPNEEVPGPSIPEDLIIEASKSRAPMTKEEWEKSQSVVRRVYDETGRSRLIKGDGEVIEEIVSRERHREINRQATLGDGLYFQNKLAKK